jgi:hypothetical protein
MDETQKVLHYTTQGLVTNEKAEAAQGPSEQAMKGLRWAILMICLGVWAVVGALFWIPLLFRRVVTYSAALVPAMLADKKPHHAAKSLREAMNFYRRGFQVTTEVIKGEPDRSERPGPAAEDTTLHGMALLNELAWVVVIWYAVLYFIGAIDTSPLDMWRWLAGISWTDSVFRPINDAMKSLVK